MKIDAIIAAVAAAHGVTEGALTGRCRLRRFVALRHLAMFLARRETSASFPEIGRAFGNRDHTTVLQAVRKWETGCRYG